jgi:hypothetical protein
MLAAKVIDWECRRLERIATANKERARHIGAMIETACRPINEGLSGDNLREMYKRAGG